MFDVDEKTIRNHVAVLHNPLPFSEDPFAPYAEKLGVSVDAVVALLHHYLSTGVVRRVAGIVKHDRAGYTINAMVALDVEPGRCDKAGALLAQFPFITHCYRRTAYPDWPYTLYTMVHARSPEEFALRIGLIQKSIDCRSIEVLRSVKEYKKTAFKPLVGEGL